MVNILVVDSESRSRERLERLLLDAGYRALTANTAKKALEITKDKRIDLVIMETVLAGGSGLSTLAKMRELHPKTPVIMTSQSGKAEEVIEAAKQGAFDFVLKPFSSDEILRLAAMALESSRFTGSTVSFEHGISPSDADALIGNSRAMREVYQAIGRVAPTDATVLVRGESGTGKELTAKAIFHHSERKDRPFVVVNCAAIPENLLESELFGYEKGAFTGAEHRRYGKVEHASGGTIFLDEIGEISVAIQSKLLRLLQERTIERIGGSGPIKVDVRVIAATNAVLEKLIAEGKFREDLFYRLNVVSITLPPLRERPEDIPYLAEYFLAKFSQNLAVRNPSLTKAAAERLTKLDWPGNVRQLANLIEKCLIFSRGKPVGVAEVDSLAYQEKPSTPDCPEHLDQAITAWAREAFAGSSGSILDDLTNHAAKLVIEEALDYCQGNKSGAARLLGISRPTLMYRMEKYNLSGASQTRPDK